MEKFIRSIYTESILNEAVYRYGFKKDYIIDLNGFESFVYKCKKNNNNYILRITHSSHRSGDLIQSELNWNHYLDENGVSVSKPILSAKNRFIEIIDLESSYFVVVAFEMAKGKYVPAIKLRPALIRKWGQITGKMHALSKNYNPPRDCIKRMDWFEIDNYDVDKYLPISQIRVKHKLQKLIEKIKSFPKSMNSFGLIHADLRAENIAIYDNEISIFDFDGCMYSWFIHDIAIILFNSIRFSKGIDDKKGFAHKFMNYFFEGYNGENTIFPICWSKFNDFLLLEEIGEYNLIHRSFDLKKLGRLNQLFMNDRKYYIENDLPYIYLNFNEDFLGNQNELSKHS